MRKRLQRVGETQNGKSELDGSSYAEFYQEHDGNLILDVYWPNHEQIKDFRWPSKLGFQSGGQIGLAGNLNYRYVTYLNYC